MTGDNTALLVMAILGMVITLVSYLRDRSQQRTIDRLTDKLMAGDYRVYKSLEGVKEEDASPPAREEETKGWYDH